MNRQANFSVRAVNTRLCTFVRMRARLRSPPTRATNQDMHRIRPTAAGREGS